MTKGGVGSTTGSLPMAMTACLMTAVTLGGVESSFAEPQLISVAADVWMCNEGRHPAKVAKKLFRLPVCVESPSTPSSPPCPPDMEQIAVVLWGDDEPVERPIEVRLYLFGPDGELLDRRATMARQEEGQLVARLGGPRPTAPGQRLEATFVLPRQVRRLEPGECLTFYANPSRWVEPRR